MNNSDLEIDNAAAYKHSGKTVATISSSQEHSYIVTSLQRLLHQGTIFNSVELTNLCRFLRKDTDNILYNQIALDLAMLVDIYSPWNLFVSDHSELIRYRLFQLNDQNAHKQNLNDLKIRT